MGPFCVTQSNPTHLMTNPTQPDLLQVENFGPHPTQPNTTRPNNGAYSLVVTHFYTQNLSRTFSHWLTLSLYYSFWSVSGTCQIGRKIKFNCLVQPNLI